MIMVDEESIILNANCIYLLHLLYLLYLHLLTLIITDTKKYWFGVQQC